jgi:hypothetical protein
MIKVSIPGAWDFQERVASHVKVAHAGIGPNDRRDFIKRAGHDFAHALKTASLAPGEEPVHFLIVGATEAYGPNRNGDGFRHAACEKYAHTFEKFARFYRNHQNKDPDKSYGRIIKAAYHAPMQRIELLVGLNGTKEAAARNGGFVADKEMQKLAAGEDIPVSMACRVPFDVCSGCEKRSRTQKEYCTSDLCKYGGLAENITKVAEDGHILHADNPNPSFFDCSNVWRPADRIAYSLGHMMDKAASHTVPGAVLAAQLGLSAPCDVLIDAATLPWVADMLKLAYDMADLEDECEHTDRCLAFTKQAQPDAAGFPDVSTPDQFQQMLSALSTEKIALPVSEFLAMSLGSRDKAASVSAQVQAQLPGVFGRLVKSGSLEQLIASNPYRFGQKQPSSVYRLWALKHASDYSVQPNHITTRTQVAALRGAGAEATPPHDTARIEKIASDNTGAEQLAQHYALYKLAFLADQQKTDQLGFRATSTFTVRQNFVI